MSLELIEVEKIKAFYEKCVKTYDEFEPGCIYETMKGSRMICLANTEEIVEFKGIGVFSSDGQVIRLNAIAFRANKLTHPFHWYASQKVENAGDQTVWYEALNNSELPKEKRVAKPKSENSKMSSAETIKQELDNVKEMTVDAVCALLSEKFPDVDEDRHISHFKAFLKKYGSKVQSVDGKIAVVTLGLEYDI